MMTHQIKNPGDQDLREGGGDGDGGGGEDGRMICAVLPVPHLNGSPVDYREMTIEQLKVFIRYGYECLYRQELPPVRGVGYAPPPPLWWPPSVWFENSLEPVSVREIQEDGQREEEEEKELLVNLVRKFYESQGMEHLLTYASGLASYHHRRRARDETDEIRSVEGGGPTTTDTNTTTMRSGCVTTIIAPNNSLPTTPTTNVVILGEGVDDERDKLSTNEDESITSREAFNNNAEQLETSEQQQEEEEDEEEERPKPTPKLIDLVDSSEEEQDQEEEETVEGLEGSYEEHGEVDGVGGPKEGEEEEAVSKEEFMSALGMEPKKSKSNNSDHPSSSTTRPATWSETDTWARLKHFMQQVVSHMWVPPPRRRGGRRQISKNDHGKNPPSSFGKGGHVERKKRELNSNSGLRSTRTRNQMKIKKARLCLGKIVRERRKSVVDPPQENNGQELLDVERGLKLAIQGPVVSLVRWRPPQNPSSPEVEMEMEQPVTTMMEVDDK